jgi:hypothetical protein
MVRNNLIPNCPITTQDILTTEDIFGPDIGCLKGKRTWIQADPIKVETTGVPVMIMERYQEVAISANIMAINKIGFLMTFSWNI